MTEFWKQLKIDGLTDLDVSTFGNVRYHDTLKNKHISKDSSGYLIIYHRNKEFKVHRLVAEAFIGSTKDLEVHHMNFDKSDPNVSNLIICTRNEHARYHACTFDTIESYTKIGKRKPLLEDDVRLICKMLEDGTPYPIIRRDSGISELTDDMISKIATGVNWRHISKNYNIPRHRRCCMNSYSDNKIPIAIMYTINMIANKLNIDVKIQPIVTAYIKLQ